MCFLNLQGCCCCVHGDLVCCRTFDDNTALGKTTFNDIYDFMSVVYLNRLSNGPRLHQKELNG